jgi:hypothetical protein
VGTKVGTSAHKSQNLTDICRNINGIPENINEIPKNINDILT